MIDLDSLKCGRVILLTSFEMFILESSSFDSLKHQLLFLLVLRNANNVPWITWLPYVKERISMMLLAKELRLAVWLAMLSMNDEEVVE